MGMGLAKSRAGANKAGRRRGNTFLGGAKPKTIPPMGDRSPKSNQKQATQKQAKNDGVNQKKQAVITAQQATKAKAAAAKKK